MEPVKAKELMREGIDPTTHLRQLQDSDDPSEPAYQPDFIPSPEFLRNQENMLRDPREIERRLANGQPIPRWAADNWARSEGKIQKIKMDRYNEEFERKLQEEDLNLPKYTISELDGMKPLELIAIARNYKVEGLHPQISPSELKRAILKRQEEAWKDRSIAPEDVPEDLYEAAPVPEATAPQLQRSAMTPEEALEHDARMQAAIADRKAKRIDEEITRHGPKSSLKQSVGEGKPPEDVIAEVNG